MGLDTVELVMEVEDRFGIAIPDDAASRMRTAGDICAFVEASIAGDAGTCCCTRQLFYRLRSALRQVTGARELRIRPRDGLAGALGGPGARDRVVVWRELAEASGYELPRLVRPKWVVQLMVAVPVVAVVAGALLGRRGGWLLGLAMVWPLVAVVATRPLATRFPVSSVGALVASIVVRNRVERAGGLGRADVWEVVRGIVAEQAGVAKEEVGRGTRIVEDLGMG